MVLLDKLRELRAALESNAAPIDVEYALGQVESVSIDSKLLLAIIGNIHELEKLTN